MSLNDQVISEKRQKKKIYYMTINTQNKQLRKYVVIYRLCVDVYVEYYTC